MNLAIHQDIHSADGLAAEGEGILRAGGDEATEEGSSQVVQFIREGQRAADGLLRQDVTGEARHVLLEDRLGYVGFFAVQESVFLAHFTLEFGEFGDHAGSEIGLGEEGSTVSVSGFFGGEAPVCADGSSEFLQAVSLVAHVAHAFLVVDAGQVFAMAFQALLAVVFKEEFRIVQASAKHLFIAMLYIFQSLGAAISDSQEIWHQRAIFISDRIVSLVVSHRRNHSRYRKLQEFIIDAAVERSRVFDQVVDFFQEVRIVPYMAAQLLSHLEEAFFDELAAFILVYDDESLSHGVLVGQRIGNHHIFFAEETVTAAHFATLHVGKFHGNHLVIAKSHEPANRTDEVRFFVSPTHASSKVQAGDERGEESREDIFYLLALAYHMSPGVVSFLHQFGRVDALASSKALGCASRISFSVESRLNGRAALFDFFVRLTVSCAFDQDCQSSRRSINGDGFGGNTISFKLGSSEGFQLIHYTGHDIGRHFFGADFQKKILTHSASPPLSMGNPNSLRFFSQAFAHMRARFLTREIYSVRSEREMAPAASSRLKEWEHFNT